MLLQALEEQLAPQELQKLVPPTVPQLLKLHCSPQHCPWPKEDLLVTLGGLLKDKSKWQCHTWNGSVPPKLACTFKIVLLKKPEQTLEKTLRSSCKKLPTSISKQQVSMFDRCWKTCYLLHYRKTSIVVLRPRAFAGSWGAAGAAGASEAGATDGPAASEASLLTAALPLTKRRSASDFRRTSKRQV